MQVHHILRRIREEQGLSQEHLAYQLKVSQNCYHKIESGKVALKVETLITIAQLLRVPIGVFFHEPAFPAGTEELSPGQLRGLQGGRGWLPTALLQLPDHGLYRQTTRPARLSDCC
ncbi:helix-turn-helix domain-containing protein [Hymenobacter persicinus]|nr:helix-turn-helix transcriptional regulator [Hymenobacter persicinus]